MNRWLAAFAGATLRRAPEVLRCVARCVALLSLALLLPSTGCTAFQVLDATVPRCGYVRTTDIAYGNIPRQKLDVYRPSSVAADGHARVVVFFHGGDWQTGNKDGYRFVGQALASRGFVAVIPNYRLYPQTTFPGFVKDGAGAIRWAHDNIARFGGDPEHLYLMGHSAGAHIAALLTLDGRYLKDVGLSREAIRATAGLAGPYDFVPPADDRPPFGMERNDAAPDPLIEPVHFVDGREPPMLLLHGLKDVTVDPFNSEELATRICEAGGQVRLITYPSRGHVGVVLALAWPFRWLAPVLDDAAAFFREH